MATEVKRRRGTTVEHSTFTGAVAELTVDLTKDTVVVHDGATQGGFPLLREDFSNVPTTAPFTHITLDTAIFDTTYSETGNETQGTLYWNSDEETISLVTNGESFELGQKTEIHVRNNTGSQINKGEVVYASGTVGNSGRILISKMIADGTVTAKRIMGVAAENIANSTDGKIITFGKLKNINTSSFSDGDILYVSSTTAGAFQNTEPSQANGHVSLPIAYVIHAHSNGQIFIRVTPIDENEYQDYDAGLTDIAGLTPTDSNFIVGDGTNWVAESGATALASLGAQAQDPQLDDIAGLTPTDGNFIVGNGTNFVAESGNTARTSLGLGTSDSPTFNGLTSTGVIITDEIDTTSITWNTSTLEWDATPSEKFNNPVFIGTSLDVDNGINADQHVHAGSYLKADTYLEVGTSATIGTTLNVTGAATLSTLDVSGNTTVGGTLSVTGNTTISGTLDAPTLNTGQGDNELYAMNQNVRTSDSVTFGALIVSGATILSSTLQVDGTVTVNDDIETADFSSWFTTTPSGFQISQAGVGDFRTLYIDELVAKAFTADVAQALAGSDILTKSVAKLNASFVVPSVGASVSITVEDLEGLSGLQVFEAGDHVRARVVDSTSGLTILDVYGTVSNYASVAGGTQTWDYTITYAGASDGAVGKTVNKGNILLDYGTSGSFYIERTVLDRSSGSDFTKVPYNRIVQWTNTVSGSPRAGDPDTVITVITQSGNLANLTSTYSNVSGFGFFGDNTFLTGALLVGDLSKAGNYLEYNGSALNVVTGTFNLATPTLVIDSTNNKVALGTSANSITIDGTEVGFIADGAGEFKAYADANNYIRLANSALDIKAESFDLETSTVLLNSAGNGRLIVGADADNQLVDDGVGFFVEGNGDFRVGTIQQGTDSYIKFDGSTVSIVTDTFDLATSTLVVDSANNKIALGASADSITIDGTEVGFIADGTGEFKAFLDANNYIRLANSALDIKAGSFDLATTNLIIDSANELITLGSGNVVTLGKIDANNFGLSLDTHNFWKVSSGEYFFKVGTADNFISFDTSSEELSIDTDTFNLSAGELVIDSSIDKKIVISDGSEAIIAIGDFDFSAEVEDTSSSTATSSSTTNIKTNATATNSATNMDSGFGTYTSASSTAVNSNFITLRRDYNNTRGKWIRVEFDYSAPAANNESVGDLAIGFTINYFGKTVEQLNRNPNDTSAVSGSVDEYLFIPDGASYSFIQVFALAPTGGLDNVAPDVHGRINLTNLAVTEISNTHTYTDIGNSGFRVYNSGGRNKLDFTDGKAEGTFETLSIGSWEFVLDSDGNLELQYDGTLVQQFTRPT